MIKNNRGQLSIFLGVMLILIMAMLAFMINVGLFVKAKINLQNATDAAAFAGAAVQARQLTNIAYLNWEMRNTYKEWMFKYYILGQMGTLADQRTPAYNHSTSTSQSFLLRTPAVTGYPAFDEYNVPSICIHNSTTTNICPLYALPGIPKFPAVGVAGIAEIHEAFVGKLTTDKAVDCANRTIINFGTALMWAYGSGEPPDADTPPVVASNHPGAWPQALELAFRMRNLEFIVNRAPHANITRGTAWGTDTLGIDERPMKAFESAYRNLSGGVYKDKNDGSDELSYNLTLTELAPNDGLQLTDTKSASGFLIPSDRPDALKKPYLDLQLMPINLATMFTTFVPMNNYNATLGVEMAAACGVSKTALPVPGYLLGFTKNPKVLTYYAVKAQSQFIGLFFPTFLNSSGVKLTAYAAAKPFGGRIGPRLLAYESNDQTTIARLDINRRSSSYISGINISSGGSFIPGMPIPSTPTFWVNNTSQQQLGGVPTAGASSQIYFGVPNMIYDFKSSQDLIDQKQGAFSIQQIFPGTKDSPKESLGLHHPHQYAELLGSLNDLSSGLTTLSPTDIEKALLRSRRPTRYDAINYLIPNFIDSFSPPILNNAAPLPGTSTLGGIGKSYHLFAPLITPALLYANKDAIMNAVSDYIAYNDNAVQTYLNGLLGVANGILAMSTPGIDLAPSARTIHPGPGLVKLYPASLPIKKEGACPTDLAQMFFYFFNTTQEFTLCGVEPLKALMTKYIDAQSAGNGSLYYTASYYTGDNDPAFSVQLNPAHVMTAYFPGVKQGATSDSSGVAAHPLGLDPTLSEITRNFYSTKFFKMSKVMDSTPDEYKTDPALQEAAGPGATSGDLIGPGIVNRLENTQFSDLSGSPFYNFF